MRILLLVLFAVSMALSVNLLDPASTSGPASQSLLLASECEPGEHDDCSDSEDSEDDEESEDESEEEESSEEERAVA